MNKPLTHEQAIQFLHEASQQLSADQRSDLAAHLAECDQCRAYANQLDGLQPALTRALHTRRYAHGSESGDISQAVLHHKRRQFMRKRIMVATSVVIVTALAIVATAVSRMPSQSWTGGPLTPTVTATSAPTPTPTVISPLPTPASVNAFTSILATPSASLTTDNSNSFKLPWTTGVTHCVTQNHRVHRNGWGLDFDLNRETILAAQDGTVTFAGWNAEGGGNTITIAHANHLTSTYMHLGLMAVKVGDQVRQGQPIGAAGSTGQATGPLLHFQLEDNGNFVDPIFAEVGRPLQENECITSQNTPFPSGPDRFEPNDSFDQATPIQVNVKYDQLNFVMSAPAGSWDNDYFKVQVQSNLLITCRTLDLSPGTDTNLILYDQNLNGITGNDDTLPGTGDKSSRVDYTAAYDGWLYILVGEGFSRTPAEAQQATYSLECSTGSATPPLASVPIKFPKIDRHPGSWGGDDTPSPSTDILSPDEAQAKELGKNPGLGIRSLHAQGITGQGVGIAIIDQPLIVEHQEYADRMQLYEEINIAPNAMTEMHGPAVASIAVGKTVGVAPAADLYYIACYAGDFDTSTPDGFTYNFHYIAQGIQRILDVNRQLPEGHKIRVISISVGWSPEQKGYDEVMAAVKEAKDAGILVVSSSLEETFGFKFQALGREPLADPDKFDSYEPGLFWANNFYSNTTMLGNDHLLVPMDSRTTASPSGPHSYTFYREGGWSWSIPYIAGMYALAAQVKPSITPDEFWSLALKTGQTIQLKHNSEKIPFGVILDPGTLIKSLQTK